MILQRRITSLIINAIIHNYIKYLIRTSLLNSIHPSIKTMLMIIIVEKLYIPFDCTNKIYIRNVSFSQSITMYDEIHEQKREQKHVSLESSTNCDPRKIKI